MGNMGIIVMSCVIRLTRVGGMAGVTIIVVMLVNIRIISNIGIMFTKGILLVICHIRYIGMIGALGITCCVLLALLVLLACVVRRLLCGESW